MRKNATKLAAAVLSLAMVMTSVSVPASAAKTKKAKLNKTKATLYTNGSKSQKSTTLKLTVGGKKVKATFKSSNTKLLTVGKTTGKVTAKKNGTATVTATYKKKAYKCKITVKTYATSVSVNAKTLKLKEGKTATIKTTVKPSTASNKKVSFTSNNKSVATVSSKGKVTAKKAGTAKITVKALGAKKGVKAATVTVKVEKATPAPTETPLVTESPVPTETPSVATEGTITISSNISGVGIKVVSGTAVYAAGTAEGTSFTTAKLPNGTYEVVVSKAGYDDVVVPVVVNGDVAVTAELKNVSLAVSSVKAINAKQIEVKFNNTMDRASVENEDNYKINPLNTKDDFPLRENIEVITLQDDAQTAIITLKQPMTNGYEYEVTAYKEIKSAAGKNLTEKSVTKVVSNDSTRPTTTSIKTLAPNLLQVTFSEPVKRFSPSNNIEFVTVDSTGKELDDKLNPLVNGYDIVSASNGETSYVIQLDANLKQGSNYNLYVGGGNGISDYAGLRLTAEKHTFTYEADKEVTTVKNFTLLDGKTAKVTFTKPIDLKNSNISVYYNVDGVQGNQIAIGRVNESSDAQSIKVAFDKLIPGGVKYFFVDGAYDLAGNKVEIGKFNITVPEYKTAEVSSVKLTNKTTIEVEFNQEIDDDKSHFSGDLTHDNKVRANIVLKDKDGKNVDIKNVELGKDSKGKDDYTKRIITLYKDLGDGNNTLTINNLVDELGRPVTAYSGTVSYANSTEFSAKIKAGKTEDEDKTVAVLSIDESKAVPTQASVENLKNWTVDTTYGKKTLSEVAGAKVKMVTNDVYLVEADKDAFKADSAVVLSNLETAAGLTIPSTTVDKGDAVNDIKSLAEAKGDMSFDGTTATINLKNVIIGSFSPSDFIFDATKSDGNPTTPNDYTVSYSNDTAKDGFSSKIIIKLNNNVKLSDKKTDIALKTAKRTSTTDVFGRKLQAG
ncbi:MAG: Ig-like domain-containing protein, partial [Lachnospiraceae bacterium]|nr:Ig-like domain-containing protein [Lachnospiraceae bacterium]